MQYSVKEVSKLTGVTIKALHHYHKIGLLEPCSVTDAGYRLYGAKELERLQEALEKHISFISDHGISMNAKSFVDSARFNLEDDFHRSMLEGQQIGLSYYLYTAAQMYASKI